MNRLVFYITSSLNRKKSSPVILENAKTITLGRAYNNDLILDDELISAQHAKIQHHGNSYYIKDLKSQNGTFINHRKINGYQEISSGDIIKVGKTKIEIFDQDHEISETRKMNWSSETLAFFEKTAVANILLLVAVLFLFYTAELFYPDGDFEDSDEFESALTMAFLIFSGAGLMSLFSYFKHHHYRMPYFLSAFSVYAIVLTLHDTGMNLFDFKFTDYALYYRTYIVIACVWTFIIFLFFSYISKGQLCALPLLTSAFILMFVILYLSSDESLMGEDPQNDAYFAYGLPPYPDTKIPGTPLESFLKKSDIVFK